MIILLDKGSRDHTEIFKIDFAVRFCNLKAFFLNLIFNYIFELRITNINFRKYKI